MFVVILVIEVMELEVVNLNVCDEFNGGCGGRIFVSGDFCVKRVLCGVLIYVNVVN